MRDSKKSLVITLITNKFISKPYAAKIGNKNLNRKLDIFEIFFLATKLHSATYLFDTYKFVYDYQRSIINPKFNCDQL